MVIIKILNSNQWCKYDELVSKNRGKLIIYKYMHFKISK